MSHVLPPKSRPRDMGSMLYLSEEAGQVHGYLSRFTYKPGWEFHVRCAPESDAVMLEVMFRAEDSRRGPHQVPSYREMRFTAGEPFRIERDDLIPITGQFAVPRLAQMYEPEQRFFDWLHRTIRFMEQHECDEWFRVDGYLPYDPHAPGKHRAAP